MTYFDEAKSLARRPYMTLEIDLPVCSRVYGLSPCQATGSAGQECFNSLSTCQDRVAYNESVTKKTLKLLSDYAPTLDGGFPCIESVTITPTRLKLGGLSLRSSATVSCRTFPYSDLMLDPYIDTRPYEAVFTGDFFAKLKARYQALQGLPCRLVESYEGTTETLTRHFLLDSITGPDNDGRVNIKLRDVLTEIDGEKIKLPAVRNGVLTLATDANPVSSTFTVSTADVGQYVNATHLLVDDEIVAVTSVVVGAGQINVSRAQANTTSVVHAAGASVKEVYHFDGNVVNVIRNLLLNEAGVDPSTIVDLDWNSERDTYLPSNQVVGYITDPEALSSIINKLCEQNALAVWHDELEGKFRLLVISQFRPTDAQIDDNKLIKGTWSRVEKMADRVSRLVTYFAPISYTKSKGQGAANYDRADVLQLVTDFDQEAERIINADYLPSSGIVDVQTTATRYVTQYGPLPETVTFELDARDADVKVGDLLEVDSRFVQGPTGENEIRRYIVSEARPEITGDRYALRCERYSEEPDDDGGVFVTVSIANLNVWEYLGQPTGVGNYVLVIPAGVTVYSASAGQPALTTGMFTSGSTLKIKLEGSIIGYGGKGGDGGVAFAAYESGDWFEETSPGQAGVDGTNAVDLTLPTTFEVGAGTIFGGGGGGGGVGGDTDGSGGNPNSGEAYGGGGGGGGASFVTVNGGVGGQASVTGSGSTEIDGEPGGPGTSSPGFGGVGNGTGGDGGAHGAAGSASSDGTAGGAAGKAVDLNGFPATWSPTALATLITAGQVKGAVS